MTHGSLFSGIGGFDLAAEWMGWHNAFHCEWNKFGRKVLNHYWPDADSHYDITKTDFTQYANKIDILTGGFPCQPYSHAGKRLGKADERHLWPEMLRAIREISPRYVVAENVSGLISWNAGLVFHEVQTDLEAKGYEVLPFVLPACAVNAPHKRDRVWFIAYATGKRKYGKHGNDSSTQKADRMRNDEFESSNTNNASNATKQEFQVRTSGTMGEHETQPELERLCHDASNTCDTGLQGRKINRSTTSIRQVGKKQLAGCFQSNWQHFPTQPPLCSGNDGLPRKLDGITFPKWRNESIKAYGNAIVPQVALQIFKAIEHHTT